jgi:hypothetical protein
MRVSDCQDEILKIFHVIFQPTFRRSAVDPASTSRLSVRTKQADVRVHDETHRLSAIANDEYRVKGTVLVLVLRRTE